MKTLPSGWKSAIRREMTPSWFGWVLIAVLGGLTAAWFRGVGADLFYPLQYAVAYWVSGTLGLYFCIWLINCTMAGAYILFGPIMTIIACGTTSWSKAARSWTLWILMIWGLAIHPVQSMLYYFFWRPRGGVHPSWADAEVFNAVGWIGFVVLAWFMTRSRWVIAGLLALWLLQRNAFWSESIALGSILWHTALFAVFFGWGLHKRMAAVTIAASSEHRVGAPATGTSNADLAADHRQARLA